MTRRLRILTVYDCLAPPSVGGVEQRNAELARALAKRGHRVTLAGWSDRASEPRPGVRVLPLRPPPPLYTRGGKRSTRAAALLARDMFRLELEEFDLVESANIPYLHLFPLAARCRLAGKPLCVTWHEYWGAYWRRYLRTPLWPFYALIERPTPCSSTSWPGRRGRRR